MPPFPSSCCTATLSRVHVLSFPSFRPSPPALPSLSYWACFDAASATTTSCPCGTSVPTSIMSLQNRDTADTTRRSKRLQIRRTLSPLSPEAPTPLAPSSESCLVVAHELQTETAGDRLLSDGCPSPFEAEFGDLVHFEADDCERVSDSPHSCVPRSPF